MKLLYLIILISFYNHSFSQNVFNKKDHYIWFDDIIGSNNTNLQNGIKFIEEFKTIKGNNQYFISKEFKSGNLTYNGQLYYDVLIKYDVFSDNLIIRLVDNNNYFAIQLIKELIADFEINNHVFLNSNTLKISDNFSVDKGFYEVLFKDAHITLLKKHKKRGQDLKNDKFAYTAFKSTPLFFIYYNEELCKIISKKDMLKLFPSKKKFINNYYNKNRVLMKYDYDLFLTRLVSYLSNKGSITS